MSLRLGKVAAVAVAAAIGLIAFAGIIWVAVLSPRLSETTALDSQAADLQLAQLSLLRKERDLQDLARELPSAAQQAQKVFARMPQSAQQPRLLRQLTQAATDAGIDARKVTAINTEVPTAIEGAGGNSGVALATMTVTMTVAGTQEEVQAFLANLEGLERSLLITSVNLDQTVETREWTMSVTGTLFVLQSPLPDLVAAAEAVAAQADDSATPSDQAEKD